MRGSRHAAPGHPAAPRMRPGPKARQRPPLCPPARRAPHRGIAARDGAGASRSATFGKSLGPSEGFRAAQGRRPRPDLPAVVRLPAHGRLRSERRIGELLRETERDQGGRPATENPSGRSRGSEPPKIADLGIIGDQSERPPMSAPPLRDLGISKQQSSDFQRMAAVPEPVFEEAIAKPAPRPPGIPPPHPPRPPPASRPCPSRAASRPMPCPARHHPRVLCRRSAAPGPPS